MGCCMDGRYLTLRGGTTGSLVCVLTALFLPAYAALHHAAAGALHDERRSGAGGVHLAGRVQKEAGEDRAAQVRRAFELTLNRLPQAEELRTFLGFAGSLEGICRVLLSANEFV